MVVGAYDFNGNYSPTKGNENRTDVRAYFRKKFLKGREILAIEFPQQK